MITLVCFIWSVLTAPFKSKSRHCDRKSSDESFGRVRFRREVTRAHSINNPLSFIKRLVLIQMIEHVAGSKLCKYTIGPYGRVTLHQARIFAQKVFAARLDGRDSAAEKRETKRRIVEMSQFEYGKNILNESLDWMNAPRS